MKSQAWKYPPRPRKSHWQVHAVFWGCMAIAAPALIYQLLGMVQ